MRSFQLRGLCAALALGAFGAVAMTPATAAETTTRMIVKFKAGALAKGKAEIAAQRGKIVLDISEMDALAVKLTPKAIAALKKSRNVEFVEVDAMQHAFAPARKISAARNSVTSETVPYGISMVQADQVSDADAGNRTLCIVDSGIDGSHPDLQGIPMSGENFTGVGSWNTDENSHGTHVAGTIGAVGNNGIGVVGVLPNQKLNLYIAKVFDASGSAASSSIAKAMLACRKNGNANVISMSLGGSAPSRLQEIVVRFLAGRNILLIAAAGNGGSSAVSYPAGFPEVVSVAAVDSSMARASFSQFNPDVEIAAPGVAVLSTVPEWTATGAALESGGTAFAVQPVLYAPVGSATAPLADFGYGATAAPGSMTGQICLIQRGSSDGSSISFGTKAQNCEASGGIGAILYNNTPGDLLATLGGPVVTIPVVGATQLDGQTMLATKLGQSTSVTVTQLSPYAEFDGTSMATPHVSGVAALVWSRHVGCTAAQMRDSLNKAALDLGVIGRDNEYGHGLVRAAVADRNIAASGCGN